MQSYRLHPEYRSEKILPSAGSAFTCDPEYRSENILPSAGSAFTCGPVYRPETSPSVYLLLDCNLPPWQLCPAVYLPADFDPDPSADDPPSSVSGGIVVRAEARTNLLTLNPYLSSK